jgi:hypothetical protein
MFERKHEKPAPVSVFIRRVAISIVVAGILISFASFFGMAGYHRIAGFDWVDSLLSKKKSFEKSVNLMKIKNVIDPMPSLGTCKTL